MGDDSVFGLKFQILDFFSSQASKIEKNMQGLANSGNGLASQIENTFSKINLSGAITSGLSTAGAVIGVALGDAIQASKEIINQQSTIGTLFNETGAELQNLTSLGVATAKVFNQDFNEIAKASKGLESSFADIGLTAGNSFKLVQQALVATNGKIDLDNITEYSTQLRQAGLNASESIALMVQGVQSGAYLDKLPDVIKETGLRLREMPKAAKTAIEGLEKFSGGFNINGQILSATNLMSGLNNGTISTFEATKSLVSSMKQADNTTKQTAIADIFGAIGEDLGQVLFQLDTMNLDLDSLIKKNPQLASQFKKLEINKKIADSTQKIAPAFNNIFGSIENSLLNVKLGFLSLFDNVAMQSTFQMIASGIESISEGFTNIGNGAIGNFLSGLFTSFNNFLPILNGVWQGLKSFGNEILSLFSPIVTFISNEFSMIGQSISKAFGMDKNKGINEMIGSGKSLIDSFLNPLRIALNFVKIGFDMLKPVFSFLSGAIQGLISNFDFVASSFQYVKNSLQPLFTLFQDTSQETQGFSIAGQLLGKVLSTVLAGGFYILGGAITTVVSILTTMKEIIDSVVEGFKMVFNFADKLSGGMLSSGLDSFTKSIGEGLNLNLGTNTDNQKQGNTALANEQLSKILSMMDTGQKFDTKALHSTLGDIMSKGNLNTDSQKMLQQIANAPQLKGTNLGVDLNSELSKMANSPFKSDITTMPMQANPFNNPIGLNTLAEQTNQMKQSSNQSMASFENNTVRNKQAEMQARNQAPAPAQIQVNNTMTSTPVSVYLDSTKIGDVVLEHMSNKANN